MEALDLVTPLLPRWMKRQQWFSGKVTSETTAKVVEFDVLQKDWPLLIWALIDVDGAQYQCLVGLQKEKDVGSNLHGKDHAIIGTISVDGDELIVYDALCDQSLSLFVFELFTNGKVPLQSKTSRSIESEQSNTSLIYDNKYILKIYRRLHAGLNPDLEVTSKLAESDFKNVRPVIANWRRGDFDLAMCQQYLFDATDGWKLAVASLRDLFGPTVPSSSYTIGSVQSSLDVNDPKSAGGDFAGDAKNLGAITAELHLSLASAFAVKDFEPTQLIDVLRMDRSQLDGIKRETLAKQIDGLTQASLNAFGKSIRVHGDFHLGHVLRSDTGWYVFDFEGEPDKPVIERQLFTSPAKDVASILLSFSFAAIVAFREQSQMKQPKVKERALAWISRNRAAFIKGYFSVPGIKELYPQDDEVCSLLLSAFETERAMHELERGNIHRTDWTKITQLVLDQLLG